MQVATAATASAVEADHQVAADADLQLLSSSQIRVAQWINVALSHTTPVPSSSSASSSSAEAATEAAVERLYTRVKAHERSVEASTEDYIRLSLSRLPRATMELEQMVLETERVTKDLERLNEVVTPSVNRSADSAAGVTSDGATATTAAAAAAKTPTATATGGASSPSSPSSVAAGKQQQQQQQQQQQEQQQQREKRMRELSTLKSLHDKLKRCSETLEKASHVEEQLRRLDQGIRDFQERGKSTHFASVLDLAKSLESVQRDFTALRQIEPHFGERHKAAMEQYEGFVELALEEACLTYLQQHDVEHATTLFHALSSIGCADAVLTSYVQKAVHHCVAELEKAFPSAATTTATATAAGDSAATPESSPPVMTAAEAIARLESVLLPHLLSSVEAEASFLLKLATAADLVDNASSSAPASPPSSAKPSASEDGAHADASGDAGTLASSRSVSVSKAREILKSLLVHVGAKFEFAIKPILLSDATTNEARIRLYEVVHEAVVKRRGESHDTSSATTATMTTQQQQQQQLFTSQMLTTLVAAFHQPEVLRVFCDNLSAESVLREGDALNTAAPFSMASLRRSVRAVEALTSWVETVTMQQVLRFFPDQVLPVCAPRWRETFIKVLSPVLLSSAEAESTARTATTKTNMGAAVASEQAQGEFLAQLVYCEKALRPRLERAKQHLEDQLRAPATLQRYAAGVEVISSALDEQLWCPVLSQLGERVVVCKSRVQTLLLQPVYGKTEGYTALPNWQVAIPLATTTPSSATDPASAASVAAGYQQSHAAPTAPIRDLGEAIMELPLALESLSSLDMLRQSRRIGGAEADPVSSSASGELNTPELVEELASVWLDGLVRSAVRDFMEEKLRGVRITVQPDPSTATLTPAQNVGALRGITEALQQLQVDLEYLQNVLSAVSEEQFADLERSLGVLQSLIPATEVKSLAIGDVLPR